jgi:hypothetical protein
LDAITSANDGGNRGQFPTEQAPLKMLYLAERNLE